MLAVAFLGRSIRLPADMYLSEWTSPLLYAAGWITVRHTSLRPYFALIVTPILTAVFLPGGPVIEAIGRSGGILPFDVFLAAVLLAGLLPVVATVVVAGAIAQEVPVALPGETELRRWPYWLAVIAFIAALAGAMVFTIPTGLPILAIVLGHAASSTVKRKGLGGRAFAITAYILGYLEVIAFLWTLYISIVNWKFVF
jgi:hypothetical protein